MVSSTAKLAIPSSVVHSSMRRVERFQRHQEAKRLIKASRMNASGACVSTKVLKKPKDGTRRIECHDEGFQVSQRLDV